jgi:hypothetical protein
MNSSNPISAVYYPLRKIKRRTQNKFGSSARLVVRGYKTRLRREGKDFFDGGKDRIGDKEK